MKAGQFYAAAIIGVMLCSVSFGATYGGGTGTAADPYQIWTPEQMNSIGPIPSEANKYYILMADLDLSSYTGTTYNIIRGFIGTFDGNGHVIRNLTYTATTSVQYLGLFGYAANTTIKNLALENVNFSAPSSNYAGCLVGEISGTIENCSSTGSITTTFGSVGGLVGHLYSGTITHCYSMCTITKPASSILTIGYAGSLVGDGGSGTITDCYSSGSVTAASCAGGLVGTFAGTLTSSYSTGDVVAESYGGGLLGQFNGNGTLTNCHNTGSVTVVSPAGSTGAAIAGGLVGLLTGGTTSNCYNTGIISCVSYSNSRSYAGGLAGKTNGFLTRCYNTGSVHSASYSTAVSAYAGGLTGADGIISDSYNRGDVTAYSLAYSYAGGLAGYSSACKFTNCYSTGHLSATGNPAYQGGLLGYKQGTMEMIIASFWDTETSGMTTSEGGTGKTTAEMKTLSTFTSAAWDFTNETANGTSDTWRMCADGVAYPRLNWQSMENDFACPDGVNMEDLDYFAARWMTDTCTADNNYCGGADVDSSGTVDLADFAVLAGHWLEM